MATPKAESQFLDWLKQVYPKDWKQIKDIWGENWSSSPYYQRWMQAQQSFNYQPETFGLPDISATQYSDAVGRYLDRLAATGQISYPQAMSMAEDAAYRAQTEGVHFDLPYYRESVNYFMTPQWIAEQSKSKTEQEQKELAKREEVLFGRQMQEREFAESQRQFDETKKQWSIEESNRRQELANKQSLEATESFRTQALAEGVTRAEQAQRYANTMGQLGAQSEASVRESERSGMATTYEEWRRRLLSELTDPGDWITKWQVQNQPNPYKPRDMSNADTVAQYKEEWQAVKEQMKIAREIEKTAASDPNISLSPEEKAFIDYTKSSYQATANLLSNAHLQYVESGDVRAAQPVPTGIGGNKVISGTPEMPQKPSGIPVPAWLPKYVPELAGKQEFAPTEKYQVATPSAQMWQAATPSERSGVQGYMAWAGQSPEDVLSKIAFTNTPNIASRWTPRRQR